jgi:hypothetical protein
MLSAVAVVVARRCLIWYALWAPSAQSRLLLVTDEFYVTMTGLLKASSTGGRLQSLLKQRLKRGTSADSDVVGGAALARFGHT